jgi:serine/threonine protein kinase/formylglycine-generating enzyme required for sulfatase activity
MPIPDEVKEEIVARFRARYIEDEAERGPCELAIYLADLPADHQELVAAEFLAMRNIPAANDPTPPGRDRLAAALRGVSQPGSTTIGEYEIVRELGRGGQATVYLAADRRLHRQVALKVLDSGPIADRKAFERFRREAEITSRLDHPGICAVYETGEDDGRLWIAMRYVEGSSLAQLLSTAKQSRTTASGHVVLSSAERATETVPGPSKPPGDAPPPKSWTEISHVLALFERAARILHVAHEAGVIHRDIKPGNVIVTAAGDPVILDFGLAQDSEGDGPTLTNTGDIMGTPAYMSPEQIAAQRIRIDRRTDIYSLGVSLYECLTLQRPFEAPTREGLYQAILTKDPPELRKLNPAVSSDLRIVVATAIEKDRDRRYQSALDFAEDLRRVRSFEPIRARRVGNFERLARWSRRNPALATSLSALFLALVAGLVVALTLLDRERRAQADRGAAVEEKLRVLAESVRLADLSRAEYLTAEAETFWPVDSRKIPQMADWITRGEELLSRRHAHQATLGRLRAAPSESRSNGESAADRFALSTTEKLIAHLDVFAHPEWSTGTLANVRRALAVAGSLERDTVERHQDRWAAARRSVADRASCPRYDGLVLQAQVGLIPVGKNPDSGLWEFIHLQTADAVEDPIPRLEDGRLVMTERDGLVFVLIPGGTFWMGAVVEAGDDSSDGVPVDPEAMPHESPAVQVTLDPFFISKYEVTQGQWERFAGSNPSYLKLGPLHPVELVSFDDVSRWVSRLGLALPTEAQWEYAARGGTVTSRWCGQNVADLRGAANVADESWLQEVGFAAPKYEAWDDGYASHAPVGRFRPNPDGLHDVLGNVWEWCRDEYAAYDVAPGRGDGLRAPKASVRSRILRGGAWNNDHSTVRSAYRGAYAPNTTASTIGLRPVRSVDR